MLVQQPMDEPQVLGHDVGPTMNPTALQSMPTRAPSKSPLAQLVPVFSYRTSPAK